MGFIKPQYDETVLINNIIDKSIGQEASKQEKRRKVRDAISDYLDNNTFRISTLNISRFDSMTHNCQQDYLTPDDILINYMWDEKHNVSENYDPMNDIGFNFQLRLCSFKTPVDTVRAQLENIIQTASGV